VVVAAADVAIALQGTGVAGCMPSTLPTAQGQASHMIVASKGQAARMRSANTARGVEVSQGR
jgi:hypothetical protein